MMKRSDVEEIAKAYEGVPILGTLPGSSAHRVGLRFGDILIEVNGVETKNIRDYQEGWLKSVDTMAIVVLREGKMLRLDVDVVGSDGNTKKMSEVAEWVAESRAFRPEGKSEKTQA